MNEALVGLFILILGLFGVFCAVLVIIKFIEMITRGY